VIVELPVVEAATAEEVEAATAEEVEATTAEEVDEQVTEAGRLVTPEIPQKLCA